MLEVADLVYRGGTPTGGLRDRTLVRLDGLQRDLREGDQHEEEGLPGPGHRQG